MDSQFWAWYRVFSASIYFGKGDEGPIDGLEMRKITRDPNVPAWRVSFWTFEIPQKCQSIDYEVGALLIQYLNPSAISAEVLVKRILDTS